MLKKLQLANQLLENYKYDESEKLLLSLLDHIEMKHEVFLALSRLYLKAGRLDDAIIYQHKLCVICPKNKVYRNTLANLHFNLAYKLKNQGDFQEAAEHYSFAIDHNITQPEEAYLNMAVIFSDCLRKEEKAISCLNKALEINPKEAILKLSKNKEVTNIVIKKTLFAHKLVEECMVAVNRSVANFLAEKEHGLFIQHAGIRSERQGEARALIKEQLQLTNPERVATLEGFIEVQQLIAAGNPEAEGAPFELPLQAILARQLERSKYGTEVKPHVGMGLPAYTTFTSPIRKYNDLLVHRLVKAYLAEVKVDPISAEILEQVGKGQNNSRMAAWQCDQWLKAEWLLRQYAIEKKGSESLQRPGQIVQVNSGGFTVRLDDCGIEGQVDVRRNKEWKFDTKTMTHSKGEVTYRLEQPVAVSIANITPVLREVKFTLCEA